MPRLYAKFILRILKHKWWVLYYGLKVGGIPLWRLIVHDLSKFSRAEFRPRFRYQILKELKDGDPEWEAAKDHHHSKNSHHYQFWVKNGKPTPMLESDLREMVADWLAADKTYRDGVANWLSSSFHDMELHPKTRVRVITVLKEQGIMPDQWLYSRR